MPVSTEKELYELLSDGWKLYFHKTLRRWYVYRGAHDRKIVNPKLAQLCENLRKQLRKEIRPVSASEIQEMRFDGKTVEGIANEMGVCQRTVYNALERDARDVIRPRKRVQLTSFQTHEKDVSSSRIDVNEERQANNQLSPLIVGGILIGIPLSILAIWYLNNLVIEN
jgi:hypothetical protein